MSTPRRIAPLSLCTVLLTLAVPAAHALTTPVNLTPWPSEVSLAAPGGILDQLYGLGNLSRIDDASDQFWGNPGQISVRARAKYAGNTQTFGVLPGASGGGALDLYTVGGNGLFSRPEASFTAGQTGDVFRFTLFSTGGSGSARWSSLLADNAGGRDHLATWRIDAAGAGHGENEIGAYVFGWEDLDLGDADYNDFVAEVRGVAPVPEPAALALFGLGLIAAGLYQLHRQTASRRETRS